MTSKSHRSRGTEDDTHSVQLGVRNAWQSELPIWLSSVDRRQHLHVIGKTGSGKTTLLRNLIIQDIEAGVGVGLIDPHGDLANEVLDHIPAWRSDDVVYFNPADQDYPVSFNLLTSVPQRERHRVASGVVGAFKNIWKDSWGPRLEYLLYATVASLLECKNVSLLGVQRMLSDPDYRSWVIDQIDDVVLKAFWLVEFARYDRRLLSEFLSPVQNKIGQFLLSPPVRNVIGQVRNRIDARYMMDHRRIFIANLSKGFLGADKANLLGAALVSQFELAAMSRADVHESERVDFFLFIDEFHNFATDSFASILSEARKYRLNLTLSHQYLAQLRPEVQDAVFGNVGSLVSFRSRSRRIIVPERRDPTLIDSWLPLPCTEIEASGSSYSEAETEGESDVPMLRPVLGKELSSVQFRSLEEQLFRAMAVLFDQQQRQCVVRKVNAKLPVSVFTPLVKDGYASDKRVDEFAAQSMAKWTFALPFDEARKRVQARQVELEKLLTNPPADDEPMGPGSTTR